MAFLYYKEIREGKVVWMKTRLRLPMQHPRCINVLGIARSGKFLENEKWNRDTPQGISATGFGRTLVTTHKVFTNWMLMGTKLLGFRLQEQKIENKRDRTHFKKNE